MNVRNMNWSKSKWCYSIIWILIIVIVFGMPISFPKIRIRWWLSLNECIYHSDADSQYVNTWLMYYLYAFCFVKGVHRVAFRFSSSHIFIIHKHDSSVHYIFIRFPRLRICIVHLLWFLELGWINSSSNVNKNFARMQIFILRIRDVVSIFAFNCILHRRPPWRMFAFSSQRHTLLNVKSTNSHFVFFFSLHQLGVINFSMEHGIYEPQLLAPYWMRTSDLPFLSCERFISQRKTEIKSYALCALLQNVLWSFFVLPACGFSVGDMYRAGISCSQHPTHVGLPADATCVKFHTDVIS